MLRDAHPGIGRVVLVGQAPCCGGDPRVPLTGRSGRFLASACGIPFWSYLRWTVRVNLLDYWPGKSGKGDAFPMAEAREAAAALEPSLKGRRAVLLGHGVASAFGLGGRPYLGPWEVVPRPLGSFAAAVLPHPSGVNRFWNDPTNRERAGRFLRSAILPARDRRAA